MTVKKSFEVRVKPYDDYATVIETDGTEQAVHHVQILNTPKKHWPYIKIQETLFPNKQVRIRLDKIDLTVDKESAVHVYYFNEEWY